MEKDTNLYLLVDIDDLLVRSSDKLQEVLNEKTNFKTDVLRMLEQLNRNCRYFYAQVKKECDMARISGSMPKLDRFAIFDNIKFARDDWYDKPVMISKYYIDIASSILNQFLEERDTFLEVDNMSRGESKIFDYKREMELINKYAEVICNNKNAFHKINCFCLKEILNLIHEAKKKNTDDMITIPDFGALVSMDTNDIIKSNSISLNEMSNKEYILYQKPLDDIRNCINLEDRLYDIVINASAFTASSDEIVDYSAIHNEKNVNWEAVNLVEDLIHSDMFKGVYFSTHHNGKREEKAKIQLMQRIIPEATGFIGQRFHDVEHNVIRRGRSSKIDKACEYLMIMPNQIVLLDDSKANCGDCKNKGGTEILYKPQTDSEIINGKFEDNGYNRILDFDNNHVYGFIANAYVKPKLKTK